MRLLPLVVIAACNGTATTPPRAPASATSPRPTADGIGGWYAVLEVAGVIEECSGLGGQHVSLRVLGAEPGTPRWIHDGGHGVRTEARRGDRFVAHVVAREPHRVRDPGWCLSGLPTYDGELVTSRRLSAGEDAAQALDAMARGTTASNR